MSSGFIHCALWDRQSVRGQILWHSHLRHTPGNLLLFMEIINSMPLKMKRQKSPCRSRLGCLEVQIESEKRVVLFSWQPLSLIAEISKHGPESQRFMATSCIQIYTSENPKWSGKKEERKHNQEGVFSRWTPSMGDKSSGLTIFKSFFV